LRDKDRFSVTVSGTTNGVVTDIYSLDGFREAHDHMINECPSDPVSLRIL
jgi:hypothetical protein